MIYLKINEQIKELINLVKDSFKLGCKEYCMYGLIALDEFELLKKELIYKNIKILSNEDYKAIIKSTETVYFHSTHLCSAPLNTTNTTNTSINPSSLDQQENNNTNYDTDTDLNEEEILSQLKQDKISSRDKKKEYFSTKSPDYYETEYLRKKEEEENSTSTKSEILKIRSESTLSYAFSMLASLFLLVLGSYYLGKYLLELNDSATYKLMLVITIVVLISEMVLIVLKMNKEDEKNLTHKKIKESSFAYKFNKKYRDQCAVNEKKKIYPFTTTVNVNKSKRD